MTDATGPGAAARATSRPGLAEILLALACFAVLCGAALSRPVKLLEPDDYAYRASIVALTEGHVLLTDAQYRELAARRRQEDAAAGVGGSRGISQWTQVGDGRWISEKNPGYPFLAAPFAVAGLVRAAPLVYAGLGCLALFAGGRRWLGPWGGAWAVGLYCSSGAALTFAWRAWMPTSTGAALLAAGAGALLWAVLAGDAGGRRRTVVGLVGFLALEGAMMVRYTDAVALAVAVVAVLGVWRLVPGALPRGAAAWWLASVALALALVLSWDTVVYGGATRTGYAAGVVTFGWGAVRGNLENLPRHLATSMPASLLALGALVWLGVRSVRLRRTAPEGAVRPSRRSAHRDLAVAAALTAVWWGVWGLYFTYYWTAQMGGGPGGGAAGAGAPFGLGGPPGAGAPPGLAGGSQAVHLVRFFVPALAPVALLGAWALARLPRWLSLVALAGSFGLGFWSFAAMASADARGGIMGGRPGGPGGFPGVPPAGPGAPGGEPSGP